MNSIADSYKIPPEIMKYVDDGFLEVVAEHAAKKTVDLGIPSLWSSSAPDEYTSYTVVWIHPDYNAEFCHDYHEVPGDLPNFFVEIHSPNEPDRQVPDLNTVDDLVDWLEERRATHTH